MGAGGSDQVETGSQDAHHVPQDVLSPPHHHLRGPQAGVTAAPVLQGNSQGSHTAQKHRYNWKEPESH